MNSRILPTTLAAFLLAHAPLHAALFTWDGGSLFGPEWTRTGNWTGGVVPPSDGTADLFFAGSTRLDAEANAAWSIKSLAFAGNAGHFDIQGSTLTIGSGGVTTSAATQQDVSNAVILGVAQTFRTAGNFALVFNSTVNTNGNLLTVDAAQGNVLFFGVISGSGGLTKTGASTLRLNGTVANLYSGATTVNAGSLELGKTAGVNAIAGALNLSGSASVVWQAGNQIANTSAVSLTAFSVLNLNGFSDSIGSLSLSAGTVQTGAGVLTLNGNVVSAATNVAQITGALDLGGAQRTFDVANNVAIEKDLIVPATIANGSLLKNGVGTLFLGGANTFAGGATVSGGELMVGNASAIGTGTLTLATGGAIRSDSSAVTLTNPVTISGDATYSGIRDLTFSGAATMNGSRILNVTNSNQTIFSGVISSNAALGGLTKTGSGTLTFSGPNANLYVGSTLVNDGLLILAATARTRRPCNSMRAIRSRTRAALSSTRAGGLNSIISPSKSRGSRSIRRR